MAVEWYYTTNKQQMGPVSWMDLRELAETGILKAHDLVWTEGMDEWVKAINQKGLFEDEAAESIGSSKKSAYTDAKPPPSRRARRKEDDEEDDEDEERETKKKSRKRKEERAKMAVGLKVGLILGGVLLILLFLGCGVGGIVWLSFRGAQPQMAGPKVIAPPPNFAPPKVVAPVGAGAKRTQTYTVNNLFPNNDHRRQFNFQQGQRVVITVTNNLINPNTDVDLYVHPANNLNQLIVKDDDTPDINRNCRVEFVAPATQSYTVRVHNLGPGVANTCQVKVEEF